MKNLQYIKFPQRLTSETETHLVTFLHTWYTEHYKQLAHINVSSLVTRVGSGRLLYDVGVLLGPSMARYWAQTIWTAAYGRAVAVVILIDCRGICPQSITWHVWRNTHSVKLTTLTPWRRSSSKCYLRIQSVPQREHHTSPLQRSTG
jgi:membrane protein YdbS with pleckstrin-like domain